MSDKEIVEELNRNTKIYIDDLYSFMSYFNDNNKLTYSGNNLIIVSAFLAALKDDDIIKDYFKKYNITYQTIKTNLLKRYDIDFDKDINFTDVLSTPMIANISLSKLFNKILVPLKYSNYLENTNIPLLEIDPYQIFDSLTKEYRDILYYFVKANIMINKGEVIPKIDNIFVDLTKYLFNYYNDFAQSFGVNILNEANKENGDLSVFTFDNCKIMVEKDGVYITFFESADLDKMIYHVNKGFQRKGITASEVKKEFINNIDLPITFEIISINHKSNIDESYINEELLKLSGNKNVPMELKNPSTGITNVVWLNRTNSFDIDLNKKSIIKNEKKEEKKTINIMPTPYLDKYGFDLTKDKYVKDPSVGRDEEIKRIEQILLYPERDKSIIITGIAGSGKTALVKGLAYRIQKGDVPEALKNLRVISIDAATLVAGTKYVGTLEEKMKSILDEASSSKDIVIFMDEVHQALGAGKSDNDPTSVSEILKPYLDYGRTRLIGATTTEEYNAIISKDDAFRTRLKRINISEPDYNIVYQVLDDLIESYNKLSDNDEVFCPRLNLNIEEKDMIIKWLIESTNEKFRTYDDRCSNPRLVLDVIKEAYAISAMRDSKEVTLDDISKALLLEHRLYKSSRENQIKKLDSLKPSYKEAEIIDFALAKSKLKK